jgi:hypothetical protein
MKKNSNANGDSLNPQPPAASSRRHDIHPGGHAVHHGEVEHGNSSREGHPADAHPAAKAAAHEVHHVDPKKSGHHGEVL